MCVYFIVLFCPTTVFLFLFACFVALRVLPLFLLLPQSDLSLPAYFACTRLLLRPITLSDTHTYIQTQSVGLLWMRDRPVEETSTFTTHVNHMRQTSMPSAGIRKHNSSKRTAAYRRLKPGGHQYRHMLYLCISADSILPIRLLLARR